jgi:stress response protein YsnF
LTYEEGRDRFTAIADLYAEYTVYDMHYEKIGKVDYLFVDENDDLEYIGVKMGFLGTKSTLIPVELVRVNDKRRLIEVAADKDTIKEAPTFDDDEEITSELEEQIHRHFGLRRAGGANERSAFGSHYSDATNDERLDLRPGERAGEEHRGATRGDAEREQPAPPERGGATGRSDNLSGNEDELGVQRTEEELRAATREREDGSVNARKRVRTDREGFSVPKKREEVRVERVPREDQRASEDEIWDNEATLRDGR